MNIKRLRLMTYNMQVGIRTRGYADYLRNSWRHIWPPGHPTAHLDPIARMIRGHDLVALQEADAGSFRTRAVNLVHHLAERADYAHWRIQVNRDLSPIARHALGVLSRFPLTSFEGHPLPGHLPGRRAIVARIGEAAAHVTVVATHLALNRRIRTRQLSHIQALLADDEHVVLMGDLNCEPDELSYHPLLRERGMRLPEQALYSYPSWSPAKHIDHILVSESLRVVTASAVPFRWSDHLPVAMEIELPPDVQLACPLAAEIA